MRLGDFMSHPTGGARAEVLRTRDFVGWTVSDSRGDKVGTVDDLLIDRAGKVRFLAVNQGLFKKRVLLPVETVSWGESALVLSSWTNDQLKGLPPYEPDVPLTEEVLGELATAFPRFYDDAGATAPPATLDAQILPLSLAKGFRLTGDSPDLTGWNVFGADGERAGTVAGMLVDPEAKTVRYLAVKLAEDLFRLRDERMVVVPTERVDLRERGSDVWLHGLTAHALAQLPAYTGGPLDPLIMDRVEKAFANVSSATPMPGVEAEAALAARDAAPAPAVGPAAGGASADAGRAGARTEGGIGAPADTRPEPDTLAAVDRLGDGRPVSDAPAAPPLPPGSLPADQSGVAARSEGLADV
ncbi:MAG: hypothetical protein JWM27_3907 [Gemmatimonadetes bacterium]|nr:hypothetical protein [Gemmatimonadota bacterium]